MPPSSSLRFSPSLRLAALSLSLSLSLLLAPLVSLPAQSNSNNARSALNLADDEAMERAKELLGLGEYEAEGESHEDTGVDIFHDDIFYGNA